jgi:hypothetical protein
MRCWVGKTNAIVPQAYRHVNSTPAQAEVGTHPLPYEQIFWYNEDGNQEISDQEIRP